MDKAVGAPTASDQPRKIAKARRPEHQRGAGHVPAAAGGTKAAPSAQAPSNGVGPGLGSALAAMEGKHAGLATLDASPVQGGDVRVRTLSGPLALGTLLRDRLARSSTTRKLGFHIAYNFVNIGRILSLDPPPLDRPINPSLTRALRPRPWSMLRPPRNYCFSEPQ